MDKVVIGNKIRQIRKNNNLSQEEFAFRIGVSRQTVSAWELGTMKPDIGKIKKICKIFDIKADELLFSEGVDESEEDKKEIAACSVENEADEYCLEETSENDKWDKIAYRLDVFRKVMKYAIASLSIVFLLFCISVAGKILTSSNEGLVTVRTSSFSLNTDEGLCFSIIIGVILIVAIIVKVFVISLLNDKIRRRNK